MKIGFIPPFTKTGEFKYGVDLCRGLTERGVEVEWLNSRFLVSNPNLKIFLGSLFLEKLVGEDIEILHNVDNLGPFLFGGSRSKMKRVSTIHDIAPLLLPEIHSGDIYNRIMKFDFKFILPKLIKNSDLIIVDSYSTKKDLESLFNINTEKIDVVHLGVDLSFFYPRKPNERLLNKYGIDKDYLFYLGDDNPRKNLKSLILAYSRVYSEIDQDLVLVGPINQDKLRAFVKSIDEGNGLSERIITPGYVDYDDLPLFYSGATALVFSSLYEGFGFAPLESMACGTPVIVPNNSSIPEVVGDAGVYVNDPLNPEEISNNISMVLDDDKLQQRMKNRGLERAKKFTLENNINKTLEAYEKVY